MSLVLEALNKARQQTAAHQAGTTEQQLQIMTGGMAPLPSPAAKTGVLLGAAISIAGLLLATAVVIVGFMLKPPPEAASASAMSTPATMPLPQQSRTFQNDAPPTPSREAGEPILAIQPFLDDLMQQSAAEPDGQPLAPAKVEPQTPQPAMTVSEPVTPVAMPPSAPAEAATAATTAPPAAATAPAPAPAPAAPPPPPAPPKDPLKAGVEYVQTLEVSDAPLIKLGAVVWSDTLKVALMNGATVQPGDAIQGVKLVEVEPKRVKLEYEGKQFWLRLP